ncbi:MAG: ROK family protein [Planctomycetales bacterium]|nr:ROK family protein [Planctomycetales bacterium]
MSISQEATVSPQEAKRPLFLGVDVGGTNIKLGVVDDEGRVVAKTQIPTHEEAGPPDAVQRARHAVDELLGELGLVMKDLAAVGLATPGTMDIPAGMIVHPHNLPHWYDFPIKKCVADSFGLPVSYANDANAASYGEFWVGSGKVYHSIVLLTLGTGVGGGIIIGDLSVDGEHSHGSECGHIIVDNSPSARMCGCGQPGHLEAYCSATALVKRAELELVAKARKTSLANRVAKGEELTALMISEEAEIGDAFSNDLIQELATWLGLGIVTLMHTIDPGAVILGGAMNFGGHDAPVGAKFIARVRSVVRQHAFPIPAQRTTIDFATLGGDAGFIGAAGIARIEFHRKIRG